jgi:hypothetical protein
LAGIRLNRPRQSLIPVTFAEYSPQFQISGVA